MNGIRHPHHNPTNMDFNNAPFIVIWEVTQACDLKCRHCRAEAIPRRSPLELDRPHWERLLDQIAEFGSPLFVISGGDPVRRPDIFEIIDGAVRRGLRTTITPSATPLMTLEKVQRMKDLGVERLAISLDGPTRDYHDDFRQVAGSYDLTMRIVEWAHAADLPVQINTSITRHNAADIGQMAALLQTLDIVLWSVFFLVPTGRGSMADEATARQYESIFHQLADIAETAPFDIKTTAAPHYRRVLLQRIRENPERAMRHPAVLGIKAQHAVPDNQAPARAPKGVNDGNGFVFISHTGDVYPSGFLPVSAGNVKSESLVELYRHSPLFTQLRDYSQLQGKCGYCEFREVCGGSRARAYAVTGDYMASEPFCTYHPVRKFEIVN